MLKRIAAGLIVAAALAVAGSPAAEAGGCLSDSQTRQAVASGQARSLSDLLSVILAATPGAQPVGAQLCDGGGGRLVWIVRVLNGGDQKRVTVDAQSGAMH